MMWFLYVVASGSILWQATNRPVAKVITLLKDMQGQLEKEAEDDQAIYDSMSCWCTTNDREKSAAIKEAEQAIEQLTARIEELTAHSARLNTEIENLNEEVASNQEALDKASKLREKQAAQFVAEEQDMLQAIASLKSAIIVLSAHHESLLQESDLISIAASIHHEIDLFPNIFLETISPSQRRLLNEFLQAPGYKSYNSQSGQIFGILKNMLENFEQNLTDAQKDERQRQKTFEDLKESKEALIAAGNSQIDKKTQQKAEADNNNAEAKEQLDDTTNSLSADEQFLISLKEKCAMTDKEWEQRQKTRHEEAVAVGKAIQILSDDDAHDTFKKTFNRGFLQVSNERNLASEVLARVAAKFSNPRLSHLASKVRLDAFTKVKESIDNMITELQKQKEDEIKHKNWCTESFQNNERITSARTHDKMDSEATIDTQKSKISSLKQRIELLHSEVNDIQVQLKRAGEDRQKQNTEFQQTVTDQRQTQQLLQEALQVLKNVYATSKPALAQQPGSESLEPAGFNAYEKNASSGGVLALLAQILDDAKVMEGEAIKDETDAQVAYEGLVMESNTSIKEKTIGRVKAEKAKAETEESLVESQQRLEGLNVELSQLASEKADFHDSCDFIEKNFDIRQQARDEEVAALRQAKDILSGSQIYPLSESITGSNFTTFLQQRM